MRPRATQPFLAKQELRKKLPMDTQQRPGFTLVEVLIVLVIMAILAAAVIQRFSDSSNQAKLGTAESNWHTLKSQIEMYKSQHTGKLPQKLENLTKNTNGNGDVGTGATHVYGPYIAELPVNPWNASQTVTESDGQASPTAYSDTIGWYFDTSDGGLWLAGKEDGKFKLIGDEATAP